MVVRPWISDLPAATRLSGLRCVGGLTSPWEQARLLHARKVMRIARNHQKVPGSSRGPGRGLRVREARGLGE